MTFLEKEKHTSQLISKRNYSFPI